MSSLENDSLTSENLLFCLHNLSKFGIHIHCSKFSAGLYLMEDDTKVISINPIIDCSIFWGIPIKDNIIASGINTYEALDIIEEIQKPRNIIFDIDYICDLHKLHKYYICDKCNSLLRCSKIMFHKDEEDYCENCFDDSLNDYKKFNCTCNLIYSESIE